MGYELRLVMFGLPKTTNSGGRAHWAAKVKEARKWKEGIGATVKAFEKVPSSPLSSAHVMLTRYSSSEPDFDGLVSSFKHVLDGLVAVGVLKSDKPSVIGQPKYLWQKAKPKEGRIEVWVTEK